MRIMGLCSILGLLVACAPVAPGSVGGTTKSVASDTKSGRLLAGQYCQRCHAIGESGASPNPQSPPFRDLHRRYPGALLDDAFPQRMKVGHPAMPQFRFSDAELTALLHYLHSIQQQKAA